MSQKNVKNGWKNSKEAARMLVMCAFLAVIDCNMDCSISVSGTTEELVMMYLYLKWACHRKKRCKNGFRTSRRLVLCCWNQEYCWQLDQMHWKRCDYVKKKKKNTSVTAAKIIIKTAFVWTRGRIWPTGTKIHQKTLCEDKKYQNFF
jgi:hypothetical protein